MKLSDIPKWLWILWGIFLGYLAIDARDTRTVRERMVDAAYENQYAHDPGCRGDPECEEESYKWHLYYSEQHESSENEYKIVVGFVLVIVTLGVVHNIQQSNTESGL